MATIKISDIDSFLSRVENLIDIDFFSNSLGVTKEFASCEIAMSIAEARQTLLQVRHLKLNKGCEILEVGSGIGIASAGLSYFGFNVTSLEPGGLGFENNAKMSSHISKGLGIVVGIKSEPAEEVRFPLGTKFDIIISNNVLEHVTDVELALSNLFHYLSENGIMIHSCPNYAFPFEPHFGIPLIPFFQQQTKFFLPRRIRESGLWQSFNFVTAKQIQAYAKEHSFEVVFKRGMMARSILRLREDPQFLQRHRLIGRVTQNAFGLWLLKVVAKLPIRYATPMDFLICRSSMMNDALVRDWLDN
jgi:2-polyprenyl-3-methyl-5-hydroxy-6-metoxy-1,4-benzoquinol methylase